MQSVRDPRKPRFGFETTLDEPLMLSVPRFAIDDHYTGPVPMRIVTVFRLNNNISQKFLHDEVCRRVEGARDELDKIRVYYDGARHLGLGKIAFRSVAVATRCADELDGVSIMGSKIGAVIDPRTDKLNQLRDKIIKLHGLLNIFNRIIDILSNWKYPYQNLKFILSMFNSNMTRA